MTQVYLRGHGVPTSVDGGSNDDAASSSLEAVVGRFDEVPSRATGVPRSPFSVFSRGVGGTEGTFAALLKSKAVPGVLGVLLEEPKEAKAPDPSPNAEEADALEVGEPMPEVLRGAIELKGLRPLSEPKRLELGKRREVGCSFLEESL